MTQFQKKKDCPSSFELLEISIGELAGDVGFAIANHLASCEFCTAELEFYMHYRPEINIAEAPPMPGPLRQLAEGLLARDTIHISQLESLLGDLGGELFAMKAGQR